MKILFAAYSSNYPDTGGSSEEELVFDQGADVGGPGDVQDGKQSYKTRESSYSWFYGRIKVQSWSFHCVIVMLNLSHFRDNPCPHLGNIVTIKLSENQENVPQTDNTYLTMIVETHFQVRNLVTLAEIGLITCPIVADELQHWRVEKN